MSELRTQFVDVVLPLSLPNLYTYRVPVELNESIKIGQRVVVQFGKNKLYTALIRKIHAAAPLQYEAKYLYALLDHSPIVNEFQFSLWEWMASYYMCTIGDCMNAAFPSGLKLSSETKISIHSDFLSPGENGPVLNYQELNDKEFLIVEALELKTVLTLSEAEEILEQKAVYPVIKQLLEKKIIEVQEELIERYRPKMQDFVRMNPELRDELKLKGVLDVLEKKAGKQLDVLMAYLHLSGFAEKSKTIDWIKKSELLTHAKADAGTILALAKKTVLEIKNLETGRLPDDRTGNPVYKKLNEVQQSAFDQINNLFATRDVVLLHGVTSSGKTEVYIKHMEEALKRGQQVLYLLPEIALTAQIINRLQRVFKNQVGVYHSKFNENERVEIWNKVLGGASSSYTIILGARSSLFLPFSNLGLIIVDEEHDTSYKQYNPAPRYNARDSAIFLAKVHGAKVILGSATPSIESFFNAKTGKYGLVEMLQRYGGVMMPEIAIVDIKEAGKRKLMKSHFSPQLIEGIELALSHKEQVILFQNRRGFSPLVECTSCAWTPHCKNCDVSLTYHKAGGQLRCHYCGYSISMPVKCGACGDTNLKTKGFGTEKIEEELSIFFPAARIARMDLDTTRKKHAHSQLISDFEEQKTDILVGTQMVTKGLDFDKVALVGILNADSSLNFPDFRSFERSYQLMAQVAGRAGRKNKRGKVIIQTYNPGHRIIENVIHSDYSAMYVSQLKERSAFQYPPYYRLIELTLKQRDIDLLNEGAGFLAQRLKGQIEGKVLGPEFPLVARIRNEFLKVILIKVAREVSIPGVKNIIQEALLDFKSQALFRQIKVNMDVDPL